MFSVSANIEMANSLLVSEIRNLDVGFRMATDCLSFINSREAITAIIGDIVVFYNSKNLNCIGALSFFFKICSHIFMIFEVKLE